MIIFEMVGALAAFLAVYKDAIFDKMFTYVIIAVMLIGVLLMATLFIETFKTLFED